LLLSFALSFVSFFLSRFKSAIENVKILSLATNCTLCSRLETLFWRVADPADSQYLKFRTLDDLKSLIGASPDQVAAARDWLQELGGQQVVLNTLGDELSAVFPSDSVLFVRRYN